jgi:hypothetical protein
MERPAPPPEKTVDDLRAILKSMTEKAQGEREKKEVKQEASLAKVIQKVVPKPEPKKETAPILNVEAPKVTVVVQPTPVVPPSGPVQKPEEKEEKKTEPLPTPQVQVPKVREPFEVPEEKLREIFSEGGK